MTGNSLHVPQPVRIEGRSTGRQDLARLVYRRIGNRRLVRCIRQNFSRGGGVRWYESASPESQLSLYHGPTPRRVTIAEGQPRWIALATSARYSFAEHRFAGQRLRGSLRSMGQLPLHETVLVKAGRRRNTLRWEGLQQTAVDRRRPRTIGYVATIQERRGGCTQQDWRVQCRIR